MTVQETSKEAFKHGMDSGLIKGLTSEIFAIILEYGPLTQAMGHERYCSLISKRTLRSVCPRFSELKDMGVIEQDRVDECQITGRKAIYWKVVTSCPANIKKPKKKMSNKDAVKKLLHTIYDIESLLNNPEAEVTRTKLKDIISQGLSDAGMGNDMLIENRRRSK